MGASERFAKRTAREREASKQKTEKRDEIAKLRRRLEGKTAEIDDLRGQVNRATSMLSGQAENLKTLLSENERLRKRLLKKEGE